MNKSIGFVTLLLFSSLLLFSCKTTETAVTNTSDDSASNSTNVDSKDEIEDQVERSFFASIVRSPCFGRCPTYEMTIYDDGYAELKGIRDVDLVGNYTTQINVDELQRFRDQAILIDFMDMDAVYDGPITDLPSATTTIVIDGVKKEVYRRYDFPRSILTLEKLFDELLTTQDWTKVDTED